ncbi:MAG: VanZ family protein [Ignavibacteria bacterium]|nr:VanZ family protein [Ignavibacteria bacterium]
MQIKIEKEKLRRIIFTLPVIMISSGIFWLSNQSRPPLPDLVFELNDKFLHFIAYFIFGISILLAVQANGKKWNQRQIIITVIIIGFIYGISDEIHQYYIPGRSFDFFDWIADAAGICISLFFLKNIRKIIFKNSIL